MQFPYKFRFILLFLVMIFTQKITIGQKNDSAIEITPRITFTYLSTSNDSVILSAEIFVKRDAGFFILTHAEIEFTASNGTESKSLGKLKAGDLGTVELKAPIFGIPFDKDGKTIYAATFAGNGNYQAVTEEISLIKSKLIVTATEQDSVRTINVKAFKTLANNKQIPIPEQVVGVYVPRMLSNLKIGEITLDANGEGSYEFNGAVVGDSLGNLVIYAMIEENETFGSVRGETSVKWGIKKYFYKAEGVARELWTPVAPIWMIITLIVMLTGVWGHYIYAVFQLIMIKRRGKEKIK